MNTRAADETALPVPRKSSSVERFVPSRTTNEVLASQTRHLRGLPLALHHSSRSPDGGARENYLPLHHPLLRTDSLINTFLSANVAAGAVAAAGNAEVEVPVVAVWWQIQHAGLEQLSWLSSATRNHCTLIDRLTILHQTPMIASHNTSSLHLKITNTKADNGSA